MPAKKYHEIQAATVCELITQGHNTRSACECCGLPPVTFYNFLKKDAELKEQYETAMAVRTADLAEQALEIANEVCADKIAVSRNKLRFEAVRWYTSKMNPAVFGDKQTVDMNVTTDLDERIRRGREREQQRLNGVDNASE